MRSVLTMVSALGLLGTTAPSWAAGETASASRLARQAMDAAQRPAAQKSWMATRTDVPVFELRAGLARDRAEDGTKTLSLPLGLTYQPTKMSPWTFEVSGAAHTRIASPVAATAEGLVDVTFDVARSLPESFIAVFGIQVPTGGEVGSTTASQHLTLLRLGTLGKPWSYLWLVDVQRSNRREVGLGSTAQTLYGELDYDAGHDRTLYLSAARWHRRGVGGVTDLAIGYAFPVADRGTMLTLELARGVTRGSRHTGAGVTLKHPF